MRKILLGAPIVDRDADALITESAEHAHVHDAHSFQAKLYSNSIPSQGWLSANFCVPSTVGMHLTAIEIYTHSAQIQVQLLESPMFVPGTERVSTYNRNRRKKNIDPEIRIYREPLSVSGGDALIDITRGSTSMNESSEIEWEREIILGDGRESEDCRYVLRIRNLDYRTSLIDANIYWFEHIIGERR